MTSTLLIRTLGSVAYLLASTLYKKITPIGTTSPVISYQPRDTYSIYRCCWNVATYRWKVHNGKIEIHVIRLRHKGSTTSMYNNIQLLHFIECDMMCYAALKSNIDQGRRSRSILLFSAL